MWTGKLRTLGVRARERDSQTDSPARAGGVRERSDHPRVVATPVVARTTAVSFGAFRTEGRNSMREPHHPRFATRRREVARGIAVRFGRRRSRSVRETPLPPPWLASPRVVVRRITACFARRRKSVRERESLPPRTHTSPRVAVRGIARHQTTTRASEPPALRNHPCFGRQPQPVVPLGRNTLHCIILYYITASTSRSARPASSPRCRRWVMSYD